jgi:ketosteroid isomerase-like protein
MGAAARGIDAARVAMAGAIHDLSAMHPAGGLRRVGAALSARGATHPEDGMAIESDTTGSALEAFRGYAAAFQKLDAKAVAEHFHEPALMITPIGIFSTPNGAAVEEVYRGVLRDISARGYARTEFSTLVERRLAEGLAIVSGNGVQTKASGEVLQAFGVTYTLKHAASGWRIVVAAIHDPAPS